MSTSVNDTKEDSTNTTTDNKPSEPTKDEIKTDTKPNDSTTTTTTTKKKKKKKKNTILYQETAIKYYDGFMKHKRFNKGINLSTGCNIFKTAWELPENNGLILPSRVIRHFKQVLPKKPKTAKNKKTNKKKNDKKNTNNTTNTNNDTNISSNTTDTTTNHEEEDPFLMRSRTMVNMNVPKDITDLIAEEEEFKMDKQKEQRRTVMVIANKALLVNKVETNTNKLEDKLEAMIEQKKTEDEQLFDENEKNMKATHAQKAKSFGNLMLIDNGSADDDDELLRIANLKKAKNIGFTPKGDDKSPKLEDESVIISNVQNITTKDDNNGNKLSTENGVKIKSSDTPITPDVYIDHADVTMDDLKPDVEETPQLIHRAETDIKHMHHDMITFKDEILRATKDAPSPKIVINAMDEDNKEREEKENKEEETKKEQEATKDTSEKPAPTKTTKKKKKKNVVLYAEDATKLFKKFNDGKRLKNGITLRKACNIFSVAWELPEENGRILPSKVARHFKQVLPSKKTAKKNTKAKSGPVGGGKNKRKNSNIKPSIAAKARTHRDNVTISIGVEAEEDEHVMISNHTRKPQSMRGDLKPYIGFHSSPNTGNMMRNSARIAVSPNALNIAHKMEPKKSIVTHLEDLIAADPHRSSSRNDYNEKHEVKHKKAASLTDLDLDVNGNNMHDDEHVVENEVEQLIEERKKLKKKKEIDAKKKEIDAKKEEDVMNAIDASLGL